MAHLHVDIATLHKTATLPADLLADEKAVTTKLSQTLQEANAEKHHLLKYSKSHPV